MSNDTCGYIKDNDEPCELPASRSDGRCHHHTDIEAERQREGRPRKLDEERTQQIIYTAANSGLSISDQANLAQISPDTLRRGLCCVETPRKPRITVDEPCDFCEGYAQAHARGAMEVLQDCRPEFRAAATFGYTEKQHVDMRVDNDATIDDPDDNTKRQIAELLDDEPET